MNGHLTNDERIAYWQRTLAPASLLRVSDHLQACAKCREELLRARPAKTSAEGVSYEEFVAWMEGTLDPVAKRDLAQRLTNSPRAAAELADLRRFQEEMNAMPAHDYSVLENAAPSRTSWILPLAAGLALGLGFLWLSTAQQNRGSIALHDGGKEIVVRRNGSVPALGQLPIELQEAAGKAAASGEVELPRAVTQLRGANEALAGAPPSGPGFAVVEPVATLVENSRPTLRWTPQEGATGYRVNVASKSGGEVVSSPLLGDDARSWTPTAALTPNETYEWEVEAIRDGEMIAKAPAPPQPEARFALLPNEKREELAKLRKAFGSSHLVMGLAYAQAGLVEQARAEFDALARENPQSELPKKLLASLRRQPL